MLKFNGERLRKARLYRGLTITELAEKIDVSKQAVSQYENGMHPPENDKMFSIISALGFPYEYFFQTDLINIQTGTTYFRSLLSTNKKERLEQVIRLEHLISIYKVISKYVEFPNLDIPEFDVESKSIEDIATSLRDYWKLGSLPIDDMVHLLEKTGVVVTTYETRTENIDAFSQLTKVNSEDKYLVVLSSNKNSAVRTQFDAAHELGHIILHTWSEDIEALPKEEFKERERQANDFAAAFLLPMDAFIKDLGIYNNNLDHYVRLKRKWKVSISAMIVRAYHLDVISDNQYQYLMRQVSKNGWRIKEPYDDILAIKKPSLLNKAIDLLLENKIFTEESFVQELDENGMALDYREIEILLNLTAGRLSPKKNTGEIVKLKNHSI